MWDTIDNSLGWWCLLVLQKAFLSCFRGMRLLYRTLLYNYLIAGI